MPLPGHGSVIRPSTGLSLLFEITNRLGPRAYSWSVKVPIMEFTWPGTSI